MLDGRSVSRVTSAVSSPGEKWYLHVSPWIYWYARLDNLVRSICLTFMHHVSVNLPPKIRVFGIGVVLLSAVEASRGPPCLHSKPSNNASSGLRTLRTQVYSYLQGRGGLASL